MKKNKFVNWISLLPKRTAAEKGMTLAMIAFLFLFFIFDAQLKYPFTPAKMHRDRVEKPGDLPLKEGVALSTVTFPDRDLNRRQKEDIRSRVLPVFVMETQTASKMVDDYLFFRETVTEGIYQKASVESLQKTLHAKLKLFVSAGLLQSLLADDNADRVLNRCSVAVHHLATRPILDSSTLSSASFSPHQRIRLIRTASQPPSEETLPLASLPTERQALRGELDSMRSEVSSAVLNQSARILECFLQPNTHYHAKRTQKAVQKAETALSPAFIQVKKGEVLFSRGKPITELQLKKIHGLASLSVRFPLRKILFLWVYLTVLFLFFRLFFHPPYISTPLKTGELGVLYLLIVIGCLYSLLAETILPQPMVHIARLFPLVLLVHIAAVLISLKGGFYLGLIFTMLQPLFFLLTPDLYPNWEQTLYVGVFFGLLPSAVTSWFVRQLEQVVDFFLTGFWIFLTNLCLLFLYQLIVIPYSFSSGIYLFYCFLNSVILLLVSPGIILLMEKLFNLTTDHRLLELANTSLPIFKQMMTRSPGTYAHSLKVAGIAEHACNAIHARGILARVGAYYHDIGKIEMADYFTENQTVNADNKHNDIRPQLSASVICSHVSKGVEKGRQLNLPQEIIDIIQQHHGTTAVKYFLTEAQKAPNAASVNDSDYRYDGPIPQFKEAAVVMLADCVEAAGRSLKNSNRVELERLIWKIIREKLDDHQLSHSGLTFDELEQIKTAFIEMLLGDHHTRIAYPDDRAAVKGEAASSAEAAH